MILDVRSGRGTRYPVLLSPVPLPDDRGGLLLSRPRAYGLRRGYYRQCSVSTRCSKVVNRTPQLTHARRRFIPRRCLRESETMVFLLHSGQGRLPDPC